MDSDTLFGIPLPVLNFIVSTASAAGTIFAVIVALYIARRSEKPRLSIRFAPIFMHKQMEDRYVIKCTGLTVYIKNISSRQIGIEHIQWQSGLFPFWPFVKTQADRLVDASLTGRHFGLHRSEFVRFPELAPYIIVDPGQICTFENGKDQWDYIDIIERFMVRSSPIRFHSLRLRVITVDGVIFKARPPRVFRWQLSVTSRKRAIGLP